MRKTTPSTALPAAGTRATARTLTLAIALAIALAGGASAAAAETLKFAHVYEVATPYHEVMLEAAEKLAERTEGRYEMEVFPASSLGKETAINEGLSLGTVDIIYTGVGFASNAYGPIAISDFPFTMRGLDHFMAYRDSDLFTELSEGYKEATGNEIVALTYYGARHVTSNKPILTPADMEDLKIRVPNAPAFVLFPEAVGANPTPMAFAEVYLALQQGVVDAQENPLPTIQFKKFYEVQSDINLTGHITNSLTTIVSGNTLASMDEADQGDPGRGARGSGRQGHRRDHRGREHARRLVPRAGQQRQRGRSRAVHRGSQAVPDERGHAVAGGDLRSPAGDRGRRLKRETGPFRRGRGGPSSPGKGERGDERRN